MLKKYALASLATELQALYIDDTICITPDNIKVMLDIISYQQPLKVTEYKAYATAVEGVYDDYELCPKCSQPLARTYQPFCDKCGQSLQWISKRGMTQKKQ